jgi:hypothetical protein
MTTLQKVASAARKRRLKPLTPKERLALNKRRKAREKAAAENTLTAAGLAPKFAAKLQAAAKHAETDPDARALIDRARLAKRIEVARREGSTGGVTTSVLERELRSRSARIAGASVSEYEAAADAPEAAIPPRLSETRKPAETSKRRRNK